MHETDFKMMKRLQQPQPRSSLLMLKTLRTLVCLVALSITLGPWAFALEWGGGSIPRRSRSADRDGPE